MATLQAALRLPAKPGLARRATTEGSVEPPCCSSSSVTCALAPRSGLAPARSRRGRLLVSANTEKSNTTTKKRLSGPPGLPPIIDNNSGGGGGGGWDGGKIARNIALNALFLGIYCLLDSGGPGGIFNGGGGGGGGGWGWGWGSGGGGGSGSGGNNFGDPSQPHISVRDLDQEDEDKPRRRKKKAGSGGKRRQGGPQLAPA